MFLQFIIYRIKHKILSINKNEYNFLVTKGVGNNQRLFVQLTEKCNLHCKHCFISADQSKSSTYFTLESATELVNEAISLGFWHIDFTGGEISTIPWIGEFIDYLERNPVSYSLFTNLVFEDDDLIYKLAHAKGLAKIITSVDYFDNNKHDAFRGEKGALETTLKNINILVKHGINVSVNTMILKDNHDDIYEIIDYFSQRRITVCLDTVVQKGRAKNNSFFKNNEKVDAAFIAEANQYIQNKYNAQMRLVDRSECGVGSELLYVDASGRFQLCPGLTETDSPTFFLGTTFQEALICRKKFDLSCNNKKCIHYGRCSFGCREKAFAQCGDIAAPEKTLCYLMDFEVNREFNN